MYCMRLIKTVDYGDAVPYLKNEFGIVSSTIGTINQLFDYDDTVPCLKDEFGIVSSTIGT